MGLGNTIKSVLGLDKYDDPSAKKIESEDASVGSASTEGDASVQNKQMNPTLKRWIVPTLACVVMAGTFIGTHATKSNHEAELSSQQSTMNSLRNKIDVQKMASANKAASINDEVSGLNSQRQSADDTAIKSLMGMATTWSSYEQYMKSREDIKKIYGMSDNSSFLKTFMPKIGNMQDSVGGNYNKIDTNGYNMKMSNISTSVTKVAGLNYSYIALVTVKTSSNISRGEATTYDLVEYTTNANRDITNIKVYPVKTQPQTAGSYKYAYSS